MKIGWSNFALEQNKENKKFKLHPKNLLGLVRNNWQHRQPGQGRKDLTQVVVVPILTPNLHKMFNSSWAHINDAKRIVGKVVKRQPHEDPFVDIRGTGKPLKVQFAKVVLYSTETLLENDGERSGDYDWEIVAILTGPWENEPMTPLTMARNYLQKPGGTFAPYTPKEFAESIYFWSQFIRVRQPKKKKRRSANEY
jgi:hypothetical protein